MKSNKVCSVFFCFSIIVLIILSFPGYGKSGFPSYNDLKERNVSLEMEGFVFLSGLNKTASGHYNGYGLEWFKTKWYGSGFLVDDDGTIFTNYHVAKRAMGGKAIFEDGSSFDIKHIKVYDHYKDIAILKIKSNKKFPIVKLGNSDKIEVMDKILAVGNTLGEGFSVSEGMINNIKKDENDTRWRITHSATIAPGNSGGSLYKDDKVIGINVAIHSVFHEIHYAIPINLAKALLEYDRTILFKNAFPTPEDFEKLEGKIDQIWAKVGEIPAATEGAEGYSIITERFVALEDYLVELQAEKGRDLAVWIFDSQGNPIGFSDYRNVDTEYLFITSGGTQDVYIKVLNFDNTPVTCAVRLYELVW